MINDEYYLNCVKNGEPLNDILVIDGHMHIGCVNNFPIPDPDNGEKLVEKIDKCGIKLGCISSLFALSGDFVKGNDEVLSLVKSFPEKFIGQIVVNPNYPEKIMEELNRCWNTNCFKEIKIHPVFNKYPADGKNYEDVYKFASDKKCPVLSHVWGVDQVTIFFKLAEYYPDVTFILGHSGGEIPAQKLAVDLSNKFNNIMLDIAGSWHYEGMIEFLVKEAGEDKVLFGTDAVFLEITPTIGRVGLAKISAAAKEKVFGLNMKRVLKI